MLRSAAFPLALHLAWFLPAGAQAPVPSARALEVHPTHAVENKVALVIGNAKYQEVPLQNPINDARAIGAKLKLLGFDVILRENLTQKQIGATLRTFRSRLVPGSVALFFYAGHGLQVNGVNYLPCVDAEIASEDDVPTQSIDVSKVLEVTDSMKAQLSLVFLDACRNNPFTQRLRSAGGGLARIPAPSGTIISFATRPGSVAADGNGDHGLYTKYLLQAMDRDGVVLEQALKEVLAGVRTESNGRQEPWSEGNLEGNFYFRPPIAREAGGTASGRPGAALAEVPAVELAFWDSVKGSQDPEEFQAYLDRYPDGAFSALARNRLRKVARAAPASAKPASPLLDPAPRQPPPSLEPPKVVPPPVPGASVRVWKDARTGMEMVRIPAGTFQMGSTSGESNEQPIHQVTISHPFLMQRTPVTVAQYRAFVESSGYRTETERAGGGWVFAWGGWSRVRNVDWRNPRFAQQNDHPVVWVTWQDAQHYIQWLNTQSPGMEFRLPTEAEWEYACRGGTSGERYGELENVAWYDKNSRGRSQPVARLQPNAFGLHDMLGNVWEWCQDWYGAYGRTPVSDPQGPDSGPYRVSRGGSWYNSASSMRAAYRNCDPSGVNGSMGFRVVALAAAE